MRVRPVGAAALLIELTDGEQVEAWRAELWRRRAQGDLHAVDIVPAARTVLLDGVAPGTADLIGGWDPVAEAGSDDHAARVDIPTTFDGEDLRAVADHWGVDVAAVVDRLTTTPLRVAFCGFAPGFAYLSGLPDEWAVPRLPAPRPRVPAGSVALAGRYAGIYPSASPGGWRLIGRTTTDLFDVRRDPPALLPPGTRVHLTRA